MKTYLIPVTYSVYGYVGVQADSLDKAIETAHMRIDDMPLPKEAAYLEGSYTIEEDRECIEAVNASDRINRNTMAVL